MFSPKWGEVVAGDAVLCASVAPGWWQTEEQGSSDSCCVMANYTLEEVRRAVWRQFPPLIGFLTRQSIFEANKPFTSAISQLKGFLVSALWHLHHTASHSHFYSFSPTFWSSRKARSQRRNVFEHVCVTWWLKGHILLNGSMLTISAAFFLLITFPSFSEFYWLRYEVVTATREVSSAVDEKSCWNNLMIYEVGGFWRTQNKRLMIFFFLGRLFYVFPQSQLPQNTPFVVIQGNHKPCWNKVCFATRIVQCSKILLINLGCSSASDEFMSLCAFQWGGYEHAPYWFLKAIIKLNPARSSVFGDYIFCSGFVPLYFSW